MTCIGTAHTFMRSSSTAELPPIADHERCDCGLVTWGELRVVALACPQCVKTRDVVQAARDLHAVHAAQRQVSRAAGESLACPCAICVAVEQLDHV